MTAPAVELQKAIFAALKQDGPLTALLGGEKIFDQVPPKASFPYVTFGRTSLYDWSTGTESGTEQLFTLHVWSKARAGRKRWRSWTPARRVSMPAGWRLTDTIW